MTNRELQCAFLSEFEKHWLNALHEFQTEQAQLTGGNRLRPLMVFWGYRSNAKQIVAEDLSFVANTAVSIELLHKASLLIDDWIDGDIARHGKPSFHIENSPELAVCTALHMVAEATSRIKAMQKPAAINDERLNECTEIIIRITHSMSKGAFKEISAQPDAVMDVEEAKRIAEMETSEIIASSLVLGYLLGAGADRTIIDILYTIGFQCGYMFQAMNDLEVYANPQKLFKHKNSFNYDVSRKNLAISTLYMLASSHERKAIISNQFEQIIALMKKYKIEEFFFAEMESLYAYIKQAFFGLERRGVDPQWISDFGEFLNMIRKQAEHRLSRCNSTEL